MTHLQFQSLGDGNCLYNTQAVWLVYAHQQQLLKPLFSNEYTRDNFANLIISLGQKSPYLGLPKSKNDLSTQDQIASAFDTIVKKLSTNQGTDWVTIQLALANALRGFVVDALQNDPIIRERAKNDVAIYLDGMAQTTYELSALQDSIRAFRLEFNNQFQDYTAPKKAITATTIKAIKQAIKDEFVSFINNKIANSTEKREQITGNVKDGLTKIIEATITASKKRKPNTLREEVLGELRTYLENVVTCDIDDETLTLSAHFDQMPEIQSAIQKILSSPQPTLEQQKQALKNWFFDDNALGWTLYLEKIGTQGANAGEFEQKILSYAFNHIIVLKSLMRAHPLSRVINGFDSSDDSEQVRNFSKDALVFEMEKQPIHWNALLPENELSKKIIEIYKPQRVAYLERVFKAKQKLGSELRLKEFGSYPRHHMTDMPDLSVAEYCITMGLTTEQYQKSTQKQGQLSVQSNAPVLQNSSTVFQNNNLSKKVNNTEEGQRDWTVYSMMFMTVCSVLAIISHGFIWPVMLPLIAYVAPTALSVGVKLTSCALFSGLFGYLITEKVYAQAEERLDTSTAVPSENNEAETEQSAWWPSSMLHQMKLSKTKQPEVAKEPEPKSTIAPVEQVDSTENPSLEKKTQVSIS